MYVKKALTSNNIACRDVAYWELEKTDGPGSYGYFYCIFRPDIFHGEDDSQYFGDNMASAALCATATIRSTIMTADAVIEIPIE
jgi:hypothetical protein